MFGIKFNKQNTQKEVNTLEDGTAFIITDIKKWFKDGTELKYISESNTLEAVLIVPLIDDNGDLIEDYMKYRISMDARIANPFFLNYFKDRIVSKREFVINKHRVSLDKLDRCNMSETEVKELSDFMIDEWKKFAESKENSQ